MKVMIIDYKMGNLGSVKRSLEECGASVLLSDNPKDLKTAERFVLPGVGAFSDGMRQLTQDGWIPEILEAVRDGVPMLGICLGMQLLAEKGSEGGETEGLGLIEGEVKRMTPENSQTRLPHVGWNEVSPLKPAPILNGIPAGTDFYFVHSYHFIPKNSQDAAAETPYCGKFTSVVSKENVFGVQFHPEKSGKPGFQILNNFLRV